MVPKRVEWADALFAGVMTLPVDRRSSETSTVVNTTSSDITGTLLPIVPVRVTSENESCVEVSGLLDQGSEVTLIDRNNANQIRLDGEVSMKRFSTVHKQAPSVEVKRAALNVSALDGKFALHLSNSFVVTGLKIAIKYVNIADLLDRLSNLTDVDISTIQVDRRYPRSSRANLTPFE